MAARNEICEAHLEHIREVVIKKDPKEDYKLISSIGTGTYGEVYKAVRVRTKELSAVKIIKVVPKDDIIAILQEIQTLKECRHQNIVEFYGSYFRNNKLWICMEYCGGFSMQDIYTMTRTPIREDCIAFLSRETLRGIEYMHNQGKLHRDIKGANILLTELGDVKIADFGVAARITETVQRRSSFIGTPYWMAPEVAAVERKGGYDEKCDIWAVGITAIEYAELQPPMFDLHPMKALRILGGKNYKPPILKNKPIWSNKFHGFLKQALIKNEKRRPSAATLLRHEFVGTPNLSRSMTYRLLQDQLAASSSLEVPANNRKPDAPISVLDIHPMRGGQRGASKQANSPPATFKDQFLNEMHTAKDKTLVMDDVRVAAQTDNLNNNNNTSVTDVVVDRIRPAKPNDVLQALIRKQEEERVNMQNRLPTRTKAELMSTSAKSKWMAADPALSVQAFSRCIESKARSPSPPEAATTDEVALQDEEEDDEEEEEEDQSTATELACLNTANGKALPRLPRPTAIMQSENAVLEQPGPDSSAYGEDDTEASSIRDDDDSEIVKSEEEEEPADDDEPNSTYSSCSTSPRSSSICEEDISSDHGGGGAQARSTSLKEDHRQYNDDGLISRSPVTTDTGEDSSSDEVDLDTMEQSLVVDEKEETKENYLPENVSVQPILVHKSPTPSMRSNASSTRKDAISVSGVPRYPLETIYAQGQNTSNHRSSFSSLISRSEDGSRSSIARSEDILADIEDECMSEDRVSEFGFRIHGNGHDYDDDDDDTDNYRAVLNHDCNPADDLEGLEITIPEGPVVFDPVTGMMRASDQVSSSSGGAFLCPASSNTPKAEKRSPRRQETKSEPVVAQPKPIFTGISMNITEAEKQQAKEENWFPGKSPEEVIHELRRLKFLQKQAWLSGACPSTISMKSLLLQQDEPLQTGATQAKSSTTVAAANSSPLSSTASNDSTLDSSSRSHEAPPIQVLPQTSPVLRPERISLPNQTITTLVDQAETSRVSERRISTPSGRAVSSIVARINSRQEEWIRKNSVKESTPVNEPKARRPGQLTMLQETVEKSINTEQKQQQEASKFESEEAEKNAIQVVQAPAGDSFIPIEELATTASATPKVGQRLLTPTGLALKSFPLGVPPATTSNAAAAAGFLQRLKSKSIELLSQFRQSNPFEVATCTRSPPSGKKSPRMFGSRLSPSAHRRLQILQRTRSLTEIHFQNNNSSSTTTANTDDKRDASCSTSSNLRQFQPMETRRRSVTSIECSNNKPVMQHRDEQVKPDEPAMVAPAVARPIALIPTSKTVSTRSSTNDLLRRLRPASSSSTRAHSSLNLLNRLSLREPISQPPDFSDQLAHRDELIHQSQQALAAATDIPSTMQGGSSPGASFSLLFEGCPLKVNATASWTNPLTNNPVLLLGTNDGIYFLNLRQPGCSSTATGVDYAMQLLFPRRCLWLSVVHDTMMSLSGQQMQLYSHNLVTLMKMSGSVAQQHQALSSHQDSTASTRKKLARKLAKLLPKRFMPSTKIPLTKNCQRVAMARNPFNGAKYLCAALENEILVMEWFNPVANFIEIKRVEVPHLPKPLLVFDLIIQRDQALPLACVGVYRHHSSKGRLGQHYRLFLVDLNKSRHLPPQVAVVSSSGSDQHYQLVDPTSFSINPQQALDFDATSMVDFRGQLELDSQLEENQRNLVYLAEDSLPVVEVVQLEHNAILVCFEDCAKVLGLNGRLKSNKHRSAMLDFNGVAPIESIVCLRDSVLVFHLHGLLGKSYLNELTQEIQDEKHIYRLLGHDRNIIVEHRSTDDPMSNSNIYMLSGANHMPPAAGPCSKKTAPTAIDDEDELDEQSD